MASPDDTMPAAKRAEQDTQHAPDNANSTVRAIHRRLSGSYDQLVGRRDIRFE